MNEASEAMREQILHVSSELCVRVGCVRVKTFHIQSDVKSRILWLRFLVCVQHKLNKLQISQHPLQWVSMSLSDVYVHFVC